MTRKMKFVSHRIIFRFLEHITGITAQLKKYCQDFTVFNDRFVYQPLLPQIIIRFRVIRLSYVDEFWRAAENRSDTSIPRS